MPRKKKDKRFAEVVEKTPDNTIDFPTTANRTEEQVEEANKLSVQIVDKNRQKGLQALDKKCFNFDQRKAMDDGHLENALRDVEGAIKAATTTLEALNSLADMIRHDLVNAVGNIEHQAIGQFQMSAHLQTLIALLQEKEIVTDDEMRQMWDKVVKQQVQEAKQKVTEEDPSK